MSYDLWVQLADLPADLAPRWEKALADQGFHGRICPGVELRRHDGFLPVMVSRAPADLVGGEVTSPVVGGFEFSFDPGDEGDEGDEYLGPHAVLSTSAGRTPLDLALQFLCAAWLAEFTDGVLYDTYSGVETGAADAVAVALAEVRAAIRAEPATSALEPFPGWEVLGVVVPAPDPAATPSEGPPARGPWWRRLGRRS